MRDHPYEPNCPPVAGLRRSSVPEAVETLSRAFEADPMSRFLFPDVRSRRRKLTAMFEIELGYALAGGVVETIQEGAAVAIWFPPGPSAKAIPALLREGAWRSLWDLGWGGTWRVVRFLGVMVKLHEAAVAGAHWYLLGLAVHPDHQGKGWGAALLARGLERARAEEVPCYLETTNPANLQFYERHGFTRCGHRAASRVNPELWGMLRRR